MNQKVDENKPNIFAHGYVNFSQPIMEQRRLYDEYKANGKNSSMDMQVLAFLEGLGFSMSEVGTYYYKDLIVKIITSLNRNANMLEWIAEDLENDYSQLYFDVARNDLDLGIKTFRQYINSAFDQVDLTRANPELLEIITAKMNEVTSNNQLPLIIALQYKKLIGDKSRVRTIQTND